MISWTQFSPDGARVDRGGELWLAERRRTGVGVTARGTVDRANPCLSRLKGVTRKRVLLFDQQPVLAGLIGFLGAHKGKTTAQALTIKPELQVSVGKRVGAGDVLARREGATVPALDRAGAELALGNRPFEASTLKGVILGSHSEAAHPGIERGALGDGAADEDTFDVEAKFELVAACKVLLVDEAVGGVLNTVAAKLFWRLFVVAARTSWLRAWSRC